MTEDGGAIRFLDRRGIKSPLLWMVMDCSYARLPRASYCSFPELTGCCNPFQGHRGSRSRERQARPALTVLGSPWWSRVITVRSEVISTAQSSCTLGKMRGGDNKRLQPGSYSFNVFPRFCVATTYKDTECNEYILIENVLREVSKIRTSIRITDLFSVELMIYSCTESFS